MAGNPFIKSIVNSELKQAESRFGRYGADTQATNGSYQQNPYGQNPYAQTQYGQNPYSQNQYGQPNYASQGYAQPTVSDLNALYQAPSANAFDTNRLTMNDVVMKTGLVFSVLVIGAVVGWFLPNLYIIGVLVGLALALVLSFKKQPSPTLTLLYGFFEGLALGGISAFYEYAFAGIVLQAVLATGIVFGVTLALFKSGKVRESAKMNKILFIFCIGYGIFMLINMGTSMFLGANAYNLTIGGIPLGLIIGAVAAFMATYALVQDFSTIQRAVDSGVPERESWRLAFGLVVTLVWLYLELLRIISYIRELTR